MTTPRWASQALHDDVGYVCATQTNPACGCCCSKERSVLNFVSQSYGCLLLLTEIAELLYSYGLSNKTRFKC